MKNSKPFMQILTDVNGEGKNLAHASKMEVKWARKEDERIQINPLYGAWLRCTEIERKEG